MLLMRTGPDLPDNCCLISKCFLYQCFQGGRVVGALVLKTFFHKLDISQF